MVFRLAYSICHSSYFRILKYKSVISLYYQLIIEQFSSIKKQQYYVQFSKNSSGINYRSRIQLINQKKHQS